MRSAKPRSAMLALVGGLTAACGAATPTAPAPPAATPPPSPAPSSSPDAGHAMDFEVQTEQFADLRILRYRVPGFEELTLQQKALLYHLSEAALWGRDIIWDQNYRHNLTIRRTLEAIVGGGLVDADDPEGRAFLEYAKRVWFSNGIHHHYSTKKLAPGFSPETFAALVDRVPADRLPLLPGEAKAALVQRLTPILFDPEVDAKRVDLDPSHDQVVGSANNFYGEGVTQAEVEAFYASRIDPADERPISWGLNSQLVEQDGALRERVWKIDGMYGPAIRRIVEHLEQAIQLAENPAQRTALQKLVEYYRTGDLRTFDEYSIAWVADTDSRVDVINGFIEVYGDPLGYRGTYESVVSIRDLQASRRIAAISEQAQWFETHSPIADAYKKADVQGISAKVITVVMEAGDAAPPTPKGINLPNANWIRAEHGSKSVNLGNIVAAYEQSREHSGLLEEFTTTPEELARAKAYGALADALHTDLHEVIGHASGKIKPGVGTPKETLKSYAATLEEARADLVALYFLLDPKLVELGVMPSLEVGRAAYDEYIRNGLLVQLARLEPGEDLQESHMRNRQMIAAWALQQGRPDRVIERMQHDGESYFLIRDYDALRRLFGRLLAEMQRIKSEGDYEAGRNLVETYGVKVDPALHAEAKRRYDALGIAPYPGFIQPRLVPVERDGELVDVRIEYPDDFTAQMLEYGERYSSLPHYP